MPRRLFPIQCGGCLAGCSLFNLCWLRGELPSVSTAAAATARYSSARVVENRTLAKSLLNLQQVFCMGLLPTKLPVYDVFPLGGAPLVTPTLA